MLWLSAGKPITAVALGRLVERGVVHWDDQVADWLPGFEQNGKEPITLRHVLTHTGGFRGMRDAYPNVSWQETMQAVLDAKLEPGWAPGMDAGYHVHSGWYALGSVIEAASGLAFADFVREQVLSPAGMHETNITMSEQRWHALVQNGRLVETRDTSGESPKKTGTQTLSWCTGIRPGGNCYGPARELGRFYQALLGHSLVSHDTLAAMVRRQREGQRDRTFRHVMDWGLGFILDSKRHGSAKVPYGYGPLASDEAFGHGGAQCAVGMADPTHGLVIAIAWNGQPGETLHQQRLHETLRVVYKALR
jgi:CubicO group peptidase (beta-lactamase class C family)